MDEKQSHHAKSVRVPGRFGLKTTQSHNPLLAPVGKDAGLYVGSPTTVTFYHPFTVHNVRPRVKANRDQDWKNKK